MIYERYNELLEAVGEGLCTRRRHSRLPLWIHNYSQKAQFAYTAASWPEVLRDARGLVLDDAGEVVARGLRKFFNLSQLTTLPAGKPEFWEKADGSLILAFWHEGEIVCSTRGSFDSPQALWATSRIASARFREGVTYCLEAIYPGNRIVVDYHGLEELVLLAALDRDTGCDNDAARDEAAAHFRIARFYGAQDADAMPANEGEGFVLRWPDGTRAKVKLDEYVRTHRLIYGTSTKTIWALLRAGRSPEHEARELPGEMRRWITRTADGQREMHAAVLRAVEESFAEAGALVAGSRAEFAEWAKKQKYTGLLFNRLDGRDYQDAVWRLIEPEFERPSWAFEPVE